MKQKLTLRRVLASAVAALAAAAAVWLLCRWVGYDLQLRIGNEPVYEIANDDYTQIIDVPEDGLWQAVPLEAGQTLYGCRLRFSTHGELYRAGMVMVDLCDADGTILREAAGNYANIFDDNFTGFAFGTAYTAAQAETLYLHIYNVVEWEGPLGLWASTGTVGALALTADGVDADATLALQYMTDDSGSWPSDLANGLAPLLAFAAFAAVLLFGLRAPLPLTVAVVGLACGLLFVRVTPALVAPDEYTHLAAAYELASRLGGETPADENGCLLVRESDAPHFGTRSGEIGILAYKAEALARQKEAGGPDALTAVSEAKAGQGSGNYISRQLGRHETADAEKMAATGVTLAFLAGGVILVLGQIFLTPLARLLGSTDTILPYARSYLGIILLGAPYMTASFVLNNQLRFQGSAAYGMVGIAAGAVLNVGLDPLLIFGLNMGVAGAALATILSQLASFCMLLLGCARGGNLRIRLKNLCFRRDLFLEIGKGGLPSLCRQGLASIAAICLNRSAGLYGDAAIAAMSVVSRAMMLAQSALIGFGQGFQPVCGFNYGAGLYHRVKEGFRFCVKWSTVFLTAVSVLGLVLAPQIIAVFRNDPEVIAFGARALRLQCLAFPLCGVIVISSMLTQTINKVWQASVLAVARQGLFFIPAVLALPHIWGELGVQLAQPVSDVCAFALTVPLVLGVLRDMDRQQRLEKIR